MCKDHGFELQDILNVYYIFHHKLQSITKKDLINADKVVKTLGLDKEWSEYYYYSRKIVSDADENECIISREEATIDFKINIPNDVVAIKSLSIKKQHSGDEAACIKF